MFFFGLSKAALSDLSVFAGGWGHPAEDRGAAAMVLLSPSMDGAMFGFGVMCYSNGVRRMRIFRRARCTTSKPASGHSC
jgi:hypothetical protein